MLIKKILLQLHLCLRSKINFLFYLVIFSRNDLLHTQNIFIRLRPHKQLHDPFLSQNIFALTDCFGDIPHDVSGWTLLDTLIVTDTINESSESVTTNRYRLYFRKYILLSTLHLFLLFISGPFKVTILILFFLTRKDFETHVFQQNFYSI